MWTIFWIEKVGRARSTNIYHNVSLWEYVLDDKIKLIFSFFSLKEIISACKLVWYLQRLSPVSCFDFINELDLFFFFFFLIHCRFTRWFNEITTSHIFFSAARLWRFGSCVTSYCDRWWWGIRLLFHPNDSYCHFVPTVSFDFMHDRFFTLIVGHIGFFFLFWMSIHRTVR